MKSGLEIAQDATLEPIAAVAATAGILPEELRPAVRAVVSETPPDFGPTNP